MSNEREQAFSELIGTGKVKNMSTHTLYHHLENDLTELSNSVTNILKTMNKVDKINRELDRRGDGVGDRADWADDVVSQHVRRVMDIGDVADMLQKDVYEIIHSDVEFIDSPGYTEETDSVEEMIDYFWNYNSNAKKDDSDE